MPPRRKTHKPAPLPRPSAGAAPADVSCPEAMYEQALQELGITVPVATCRLVNDRLEFRLYGGRVIYWPPLPTPDELGGRPPDELGGRPPDELGGQEEEAHPC